MLVRAVLVLLLVVAGAILFLFLIQRQVIFPRHLIPPGLAMPDIPELEVWWVGPQESVEAWFLPPLEGEGPFPAVIATHGNGELIDFWAEPYEPVRRWGVAVLLVEYPGYGRSGGSPSEASITATVVGAYDRLVARPEIDPDRIVAHGRSLGGGAACALAARRPVRALVLESAFASVRSIARRYGLVGPLVRDPFDNLAVVSGYDGPILIVHGTDDGIIPVDHAHRLHAAALDSEIVLKACGHNDCPPPWPEMRRFLEARGVLPPGSGE